MMPDMEKVVKGLEICSEHGSWHGLDCELNEAYKDCPYRGCETGCIVTIAKDALALLKQEAVEVIHHEAPYGYPFNTGKCPVCFQQLDEGDKFCRECGQAVKWE